MSRLTPSPWYQVPPCPVTAGQVDRALAWLKENAHEVRGILPLVVDGHHFGEDYCTIVFLRLATDWQQWRASGNVSAGAIYIAIPIGKLKNEINRLSQRTENQATLDL